MKYLITGAYGFVGQHLVKFLCAQNRNNKVFGIVRNPTAKLNLGYENIFYGDLLDMVFLEDVVKMVAPDIVIHLASQSSVSKSWLTPNDTFTNNVNIFLNLLDTLRKFAPTVRLLSVGSSEEYGGNTDIKRLFTETDYLNPTSPYAVARVAQSQLAMLYAAQFNMDIICTRSFNHYGENQRLGFVIPDFIQKVNNYRLNNEPVNVGNIDVIRDFIHVDDVVRSYGILINEGKTNEIYNICSGAGIVLKDLLKMIFNFFGVDFTHRVDAELVRPVENSVIVGDNSRIINSTSWKPKVSLSEGLERLIKLKNF